MRALVIAIVLAGCGGSDAGQPITDSNPAGDGATGDGSPGCGVSVTFEPPMPFAFPGSRTRAVVHVSNAPGVLMYQWQVKRNGTTITYDPAAPDNSAVEFDTAIAAPYETMVMISGTSQQCPSSPFSVNVAVPGANSTQVRLRVYPPPTVAAPPSEKLVLVSGGADQTAGVVSIDPGLIATGTATTQAYLRFIPLAARDAYIEAFSGATGTFSVRVLNQAHDVLVVPIVAGFAPRLVTGWLPGSNLTVDAGIAVTGTVRDQNNALLAGAKVQMTIGGVPTTLATTDVNGAFTVRSSVTTGAATIEVTPPATTGLPRLVASSAAFDFSSSITVAYSAAQIRDLSGSVVKRNTVAQPGAQVIVTGTIANAGTIGGVAATGEVRASGTANGAGVLPSIRAPDALLSAVTMISPADFGVATLDLRAGVPATVDAPPMVAAATQLRNLAMAPLPGAVFEAVPKGALGMTGLGTIRVVADGSGNVTTQLAANTIYDLHLSDPQGTSAPRTVSDVTTVDATYDLPKAIRISGSLTLSGNPQVIGNAAVQILCAVGASCVGTARSIPLAEAASAADGKFSVGVLDPGTM